MTGDGGATLGQFIAARLVEVGCTDYFGVPGDASISFPLCALAFPRPQAHGEPFTRKIRFLLNDE